MLNKVILMLILLTAAFCKANAEWSFPWSKSKKEEKKAEQEELKNAEEPTRINNNFEKSQIIDPPKELTENLPESPGHFIKKSLPKLDEDEDKCIEKSKKHKKEKVKIKKKFRRNKKRASGSKSRKRRANIHKAVI